MYDITNETVIARGLSKDEAMRESKGCQKNLVYVCNIFNELSHIYLRSQRYNLNDKIIFQEAVSILQQHVDSWKERLDNTNMDFYYAITLPTNWSPEIREKLIRPLFIQANLIHKSDGQGRLIFFTELEPTFRNMQSDRYSLHTEIQPGKQYVLCSLDLQAEIHVNLELISTRYPPALKTIDNNYVAHLLNQTHFTIPFGLEQVKSSLIDCLENKLNNTISAPEVIDMMFKRLDKSGDYLQQLAVSS